MWLVNFETYYCEGCVEHARGKRVMHNLSRVIRECVRCGEREHPESEAEALGKEEAWVA